MITVGVSGWVIKYNPDSETHTNRIDFEIVSHIGSLLSFTLIGFRLFDKDTKIL